MLEQESEGKAGICSGPLIRENTQSYKGLGNIGLISFILSPHWQKIIISRTDTISNKTLRKTII